MEETSRVAGVHLETVTGNLATTIDALLDRTAQAIDQSRLGITAQGEEMLAMVASNQAALDRAARDSADALAERLTTVDGAIARLTADWRPSGSRARP